MTDPFDLNRYAVGGAAPGPSGEPGWDASTGEGSQLAVGTPPVPWLVGAVAAALAGGVLAAFAFRTGPATFVPWVLAGPVGIVLLGVYSIVDTRRRALSVYAAASWVTALYIGAVVLILAAVIVTALNIAFWVGHL